MSVTLMKRAVVGFCIAICLFSTNASAAYTEAEADQIAQEISETTMSPFCPGRTLSACPSGQARDLRTQVKQWLEQGYTPEGVRNQLLTIYGDEVRGTPSTDGFGIMAWLVPAFVIVLTFLLIVYALKNLRAQRIVTQQLTSQSTVENDTALLLRVEKEVKKRMGS